MLSYIARGAAQNINVQPVVRRPTLDWGNALTQGLLLSAYNSPLDALGPPLNYVTGRVGTTRAVTKGAAAFFAESAGAWTSTTPTVIPGRIVGPASFNGATSWAQFPINLDVFRRLTIAFWYKRATAADSVLIEYGPSFDPDGFLIDPQSGGTMLLAIKGTINQVNYFLGTQIPLNEWHHHVITPDRLATTPQLAYWNIDGVAAAVSSGGPLPGPGNWVTNGNINVGGRNGSATGAGALDIAGLHIWGRTLTAAEAVAVYRRGWSMFRLPRTQFTFPYAATGVPSRWFLMQ